MKHLFLLTIAAIIAVPAQVQAAGKTLKVINRRDEFPIMFVYITPGGTSDWGSDQLGGEVIGAGESYSWNITWDTCYVDVKAKTFTGLSVERRNLNVCGGAEWTVYDEKPSQQRRASYEATPQQQNKSLQLVNKREAFPIWKVYITSAGELDWGQDQLGDKTLGAGQSQTWTIPWDGCYVDVRAVTFTGIAVERRNLNVCGGTVWTVFDTNPKN